MAVANPVIGDSRVLKTAQTVRKLGYRLCLYGVGTTGRTSNLEGNPFEVVLLPNPRFEMERLGRWSSQKDEIDYELFCQLAADSLFEHLAAEPPDILHTHDMLGLAIGAYLVNRMQGPRPHWIHDVHEYVVGLTDLPSAVREYFAAIERAHIHTPDALTCVSPALALILKETYSLRDEPTVVLNAPRRSDFDPFCTREIRAELRLARDVPVVVYSGGVKPIRGVDTVIEALPSLPETHLAIVTNSSGKHVSELRERAAKLGVSERVHYHPYVPFQDVTSFLCSASVGVHPIHRYPNAEIALPNKLFEYLHAGLPVVVSDNKCMRDFVRENGCGEAFEAGDPRSLASALAGVLATRREKPSWTNEICGLAQKYAWEDQEEHIAAIYDTLAAPKARRRRAADTARVSDRIRIAQLPVGAAGQPKALADALTGQGAAAGALVISDKYHYGADVALERSQLRMPRAAGLIADLTQKYDVFHYHARPLLLERGRAFPTGWDLFALRAAGKKVFFHFRGSEVRLASVFEKSCRFNYVAEDPGGVCSNFQETVQREFMGFARGVCHGIFVTDPELQTYAPWAQVVPRVVDLRKWQYVGVQSDGPLRVVHAPTLRGTKGSDCVLAAVQRLRAEGASIEFKLVEKMANDEARELYRWADVVIDQVRIGWYGVFAVEAMALGKAVVVYIREDLKHHLPYPSPVAVANPDNLYDVLRHLAENRCEVAELGIRGRRYAEQVHDADRVAGVLLETYAEEGNALDAARVAGFVLAQAQHLSEYLSPRPRGAVRRVLVRLGQYASRRNVAAFFSVVRAEGPLPALRKASSYVRARTSREDTLQPSASTRETPTPLRQFASRRNIGAFCSVVRSEGIAGAIRKAAARVKRRAKN